MAKTDTLSIRLSPEALAQLTFIATATQRSKSFLGSEAVERFIKSEADIIRGIQAAQAQAAEGAVLPHSEAMLSMRAAIKRGAKQGKKL